MTARKKARATPAPLAALRNLSKIYENGTAALKGVDLELRGGELLSLLGASGCGKTTLLRLIAGIIPPSAGEIVWRGGERPRETGFVFQEAALMPWATVAENAALPLRLLDDTQERDARVQEALHLAGLRGFENAYPHELSGGMKMRASIARALIVRPRLLLMDEPFAAIDEVTRFRFNDELLALWRKLECTIVFVTHSVYEAAFLSTRTLVFSPRPGRVTDEYEFAPPKARGDFRASPEFTARARKLSASLAKAMRSAA